jgi:hypothetical protein
VSASNGGPGDERPPVITPVPTTRLSLPVAATIGVLAVWAALGVGHLTAGLLSAASSPLFAVGDAVVRLSPESLVEFAKTTFGTGDKLVLLSATCVVITLVGALAGLLSRERPNTGAWALAAMGGLGAAAVYSAPVYARIDLVAPAMAMAGGPAHSAGCTTSVYEPGNRSWQPRTECRDGRAQGRVRGCRARRTGVGGGRHAGGT